MSAIIGVVGQIACGKGVLVDYLMKEFGFLSFSLSSIVHDELHKKGIVDYTRKDLQDIGDRLRKHYGRDVLAKRAMKKLAEENGNKRGIIIEGIRNTAEVEYLKKLSNFTLLGVKAKREFRFDRLFKRNKPWDPKKWEEFVAVDRRDLGRGQGKEGQQVGKCLAYCDYVFTNNRDIKDFQRKIKKAVEKIIKT